MAQLNQNLNLSTFRMKKMKKGIQAPGKAPLAVLPQNMRKKPSNLPAVGVMPSLPQAAGMTAPTSGLPKAKTMSTPMGIMGKGLTAPKLPKNG